MIPGKDGHVRVARVKTETGELVRPVQKLYNLELQEPEINLPKDLTDSVIRTRRGGKEIWEGGFDWDEELGKNLRTKWEKWCKEVHSLVDLSIPSERAYGAIAYIRYKANSDFHVNFVSSKARVAPLKKLSLPRLELLVTLIGARLLETLRKVFKITNNYIMFSDSTVALSWIRGYAKQWKPFVLNRVHEIQDLTNPQNWRFVKEQNPAVIVSRGCRAEESLKNRRLWHGPHWLTLSEENWPKNERLFQETILMKKEELKYSN
ncbi:uncharacterized protein TNCV_307391 [Trichonephila clavipes]|nr:uncharacterized protein TNCV_307391 [Trichonephila clavipes]